MAYAASGKGDGRKWFDEMKSLQNEIRENMLDVQADSVDPYAGLGLWNLVKSIEIKVGFTLRGCEDDNAFGRAYGGKKLLRVPNKKSKQPDRYVVDEMPVRENAQDEIRWQTPGNAPPAWRTALTF